MVEEWLKPSSAANRLQMPPSTLRVYSTRFAPILSPSASEPPTGQDGKRGSRLYSSADIAILARAKELLSTGMTYDQVLADLRLSLPGARNRSSLAGSNSSKPAQTSAESNNGHIESLIAAPQIEAVITGLVNAAIANSERMIHAWQELAEERAKEVSMLRARIRDLEDERRAANGKRSGGIGRLFGGQ